MSAEESLAASVWLAAIGVAVIALERILLRALYRDGGPLGWDVLRRRHAARPRRWLAWADRVFQYPTVVWLYGASLAAAFGLLRYYPAAGVPSTVLTLVVLAQLLLTNVRTAHWGRDGAHNMLVVVFGAAAIQRIAPDSQALRTACVWFVALQGCLAYAASGLCKLAEPEWRRGTAVLSLFRNWPFTPAWAVRPLGRRPLLVRCLTYGTLAMEISFPLALVVGRPWCWVFLGWGLAFHVANLIVLRLNHFPWAYGATYPAIVYCSTVVRTLALPPVPGPPPLGAP
jgi:hypothetical protein